MKVLDPDTDYSIDYRTAVLYNNARLAFIDIALWLISLKNAIDRIAKTHWYAVKLQLWPVCKSALNFRL